MCLSPASGVPAGRARRLVRPTLRPLSWLAREASLGRAAREEGSVLEMEGKIRLRASGGGKIIICIFLRSENSVI